MPTLRGGIKRLDAERRRTRCPCKDVYLSDGDVSVCKLLEHNHADD